MNECENEKKSVIENGLECDGIPSKVLLWEFCSHKSTTNVSLILYPALEFSLSLFAHEKRRTSEMLKSGSFYFDIIWFRASKNKRVPT